MTQFSRTADGNSWRDPAHSRSETSVASPTLHTGLLCPTPAAPRMPPPATPCTTMTVGLTRPQSGTIVNLDQCRCGVMALAGNQCRSSNAARWLPLCTVNVHSPIQVYRW